MKNNIRGSLSLLLLGILLISCAPAPASTPGGQLKVLAVESFLADIAQNVAGTRLTVDTLMPLGMDPHAYQPTPQDVTRIAGSQLLIINGAHFEEWLDETLANAGGQGRLLEASAGLTSRQPGPSELLDPDHAGDPHFWLDPLLAIQYTENIRDGLSAVDPAGKDEYARNAQAYIVQLTELDAWIKTRVETIPAERRLLVTNHESFGYFADRYGFKIAGTVIPGTSSEASSSARQMVTLIENIKASGARAIFLETGANPQLAEQIAAETNTRVITGLYTHSITPAGGDAPTYIAMLKRNTELIVAALQ